MAFEVEWYDTSKRDAQIKSSGKQQVVKGILSILDYSI